MTDYARLAARYVWMWRDNDDNAGTYLTRAKQRLIITAGERALLLLNTEPSANRNLRATCVYIKVWVYTRPPPSDRWILDNRFRSTVPNFRSYYKVYAVRRTINGVTCASSRSTGFGMCCLKVAVDRRFIIRSGSCYVRRTTTTVSKLIELNRTVKGKTVSYVWGRFRSGNVPIRVFLFERPLIKRNTPANTYARS